VPLQTELPPEHCSPSKTHVLLPGSQHPSVQAVPVVQHEAPVKPQLVLTPPSLSVLPHVTEPVPVSVSVVEPSVQTILQLDTLPLDVQISPSVDSVPHRQIVTPFSAAVQHTPLELLLVPEQPEGSPRTNIRPKANPTAPERFMPRS
jgi:hypothetical protein